MPPRKRTAAAAPELVGEAAVDAFLDQCAAQGKRLKKACYVLEPLDEEEAEEATMESLQDLPVVYAPKEAEKEMQKVGKELTMVGVDDEDKDQHGGFVLRMTNTASSYDGHAILNKHLKRLDKKLKAKDWKGALCTALGISVAGHGEDFWYQDTDSPENVEAIMEALNGAWEQLFQRTDAELGLGGDASRAAIESFLEKFNSSVDECCLGA